MLLSAVSVLVAAQSSSEIPEGLTNNPVYLYTEVSIAKWSHRTNHPLYNRLLAYTAEFSSQDASHSLVTCEQSDTRLL